MKNAAQFIQNMPTNHYVNEAKANLEGVNNSIAYCKEALACPTLENWERKEFVAGLAFYESQLLPAIERLNACLKLAL